MQAELTVERIERRLSPDEISDADWLATEIETDSEGRLTIVKSCRFSNEDIAKYGAAQVQAWIEEDHRRYDLLGQDWWFVDALAVAIIGVHAGKVQLGTFEIFSGCVGGVESDAPREYLDELTGELVTELKEQLVGQGLIVPEGLDTPLVCSGSCLVDAL